MKMLRRNKEERITAENALETVYNLIEKFGENYTEIKQLLLNQEKEVKENNQELPKSRVEDLRKESGEIQAQENSGIGQRIPFIEEEKKNRAEEKVKYYKIIAECSYEVLNLSINMWYTCQFRQRWHYQ
eukprot:TRINITY_DN89812_c0_g1_i1.p4 TRINITY_DN89812_c0_g1~~TRINITY_DN89812_c0_g1_i1.p4  ORF type:complete len:129 (-),score=12.49 TRINITY_DN89812_c0_g1_i1:554-940(-)